VAHPKETASALNDSVAHVRRPDLNTWKGLGERRLLLAFAFIDARV